MLTEKITPDWIITPGLRPVVENFLRLCDLVLRESKEEQKISPIILMGSSGVGKSLFVYIFQKLFQEEHNISNNKIVRLNCATFTNELIASELFGYEKGAFTGATSAKVGLLEVANGGLLILEEIGEISQENQAKLLTFLEDGYFYRVGGVSPQKSDVQIISTSNKPKEHFREDFWFRFFPFYVPALCQRRGDVLYYLAAKFPDIISELLSWEVLLLLAYHWPGNVREIDRLGRLIRLGELQSGSMQVLNEMAGLLKTSENEMTEVDENYHLLNSFASFFNLNQDSYTTLDFFKPKKLFDELIEFNIQIDVLESELNRYGLGLDVNNRKAIHPFQFFTGLSFSNENEITKRTGLILYDEYKPFSDSYTGLMFFSHLFLHTVNSDYNLLDADPGNPIHINPFILAMIYFAIDQDSEDHEQFKEVLDTLKDNRIDLIGFWNSYFDPNVNSLMKEIFAFRTGLQLPEEIVLPRPFTKAADNFINELRDFLSKEEIAVLDIFQMTEVELLHFYYNGLIKKAGGVKREAAKLAGINEKTFHSRLKEIGSKHLF
jgi:hypothetical protein